MACRKGAMPHSTGFARGQGGMLRYSANHPGPVVALRMRPGHGPWCERSIATGERGGNQRKPRAPCVSGGRRRGRDGASKRRDAACHGLRPRGQGGMLRYSSHHPGPTCSLRMRPGHGPWCERSIATGERGGNQRKPRAPCVSGGRRRGRDGASKRRDAACHGLRPRGQGGMLRYSSHHPGPTSSLRMRPGHGPWCERSIARVGLGVHSPPCGRRTRWSPTAPPEGAGFPWWRAPS